MASLLRTPLVLFGFVVDLFRRLPGASFALRHSGLIAGSLMVGAVLAFAVWTATVAPQRVSLADLVEGKLSIMQSWIIVTGDLVPGETRIANYAYVMTDPAVPNARMNIYSDNELPVGRATVSGTFGGPREPNPAGYQWVGSMRADPVMAPELGPPWIAIALVAGAVFVVWAARTSYPAFFAQAPGSTAARPATIKVAVRWGVLRSNTPVVMGEVLVRDGQPITLVAGGERQTVRLHSAHTGAEAGELRHVGKTEPALRIRLAHEEMTLTFESSADRDAALAALRSDAEGWPGRAAAQSQPAPT